MSDSSFEKATHFTYKEELKRRAWETLPTIQKLILFIENRFGNKPFEGSDLYDIFQLEYSKSRRVLIQHIQELKKKQYLIAERISYKRRLWKPTKKLFQQAAGMRARLEKNIYIGETPGDAFELRGHLRPLGRKSVSGVHLNVFSKALSDVARQHMISYQIYRSKDSFIIRSDDGPRKAHARKWGIDLSVRKCLLYNREIELLKNRKLVPVSVFIVPEDWGLKNWGMFKESRENQMLARELSKSFPLRVLPRHNYAAGKWRFDISFDNFIVEITTFHPGVNKSNPRSSSCSVVRSKILDALLFSLQEKKKSFVVLSTRWKEKPHMLELKSMTREYECFLIFADFGVPNWPEVVAREIIKKASSHTANL